MSSGETTTAEKTQKTEGLSFDKLASEVLHNSREDRQEFLELIDAMKKLMQDNPEVSVVMVEQIVRSFDVLNKMNGQLSALATSVYKRDSHVQDEDPTDGVYEDIGELVQPGAGH